MDEIGILLNILLVKSGKRPRFLIDDYRLLFEDYPEILKQIQLDPELKLEGKWVCHITDNFKFSKRELSTDLKITKKYKEDHMERGTACGIPLKAINHFIKHGICGPHYSYSIAVTKGDVIREFLFGFVYKDLSFKSEITNLAKSWEETLELYGFRAKCIIRQY